MPDIPASTKVSQITADCDVLVIGSGASGFAAALTARAAGLDVLMIEKASVFGGTTCYSAGVIWVPGSRQARAAGIADSREAALTYLSAEGGNQLDRAKAETYVDRAADVLAWFEDNTHADFALVPTWPDYHPDQPGGVAGGRSLGPRPFDGRTLGQRFGDLRPPLKTTTILGGMVVGRQDVPAFYSMTRSWKSAAHIGGLVARHARDRLGYPRGTRLSNGNALIAMLARSAFEQGVELKLNTPLEDFLIEDGRVVGARIGGTGGERTIHARRGVVLASGGFPASPELRRRFYPHEHGPSTHRTLAPDAGNDPAGLEATVARFNAGAAEGIDPEFGKGGDVYQRFNGSAGHSPNPCVAMLTEPPFYAIRLVPGDIGTFVGLKTDAHARALDGEGQVIDGLYVVGNDAASFIGGAYPGAGITIGPALVFGHLAARHIAAN